MKLSCFVVILGSSIASASCDNAPVDSAPAAQNRAAQVVQPEVDTPVAQLKLLTSGLSQKLPAGTPIKITLSNTKPEGLTVEPSALESPLYGSLPFGPASTDGTRPQLFMILVEPAQGDARLFVDVNRNGNLTDDSLPEWKLVQEDREGTQLSRFVGHVDVALDPAKPDTKARLTLYRFDPRQERYAGTRMSLLCVRDYVCEGVIPLGGRTLSALLVDEATCGDFRGLNGSASAIVHLLLDVDQNGTFDPKSEAFDIDRPFNIAGASYEVADMSPDGTSFRIIKASLQAPSNAKPASHAVGEVITPFSARTMDGNKVNFPTDYAGKIVLLDFWATWCGPCMAEVPDIIKSYEKYHDRGFEVLGVSIDTLSTANKVTEKVRAMKMTWPQVHAYDTGPQSISRIYQVRSIPMVYLVDGDSGVILASSVMLRQGRLDSAVASALAKRDQLKAQSSKSTP